MAGPTDSTGAEPRPKIAVPSRTYGFPPEAFDWSRLPDVDTNFLPPEHIEAFIQALSAPDPIPQSPDAEDPTGATSSFRLNSPGYRGSITSFDIDLTKRVGSPGVGDLPDDGERDLRDEAAETAAPAAAPGPATSSRIASRQPSSNSLFISARNDWAPVNERIVRGKGDGKGGEPSKKGKKSGGKRKTSNTQARSKDETREGYFYALLKWPFLLFATAWLVGLSIGYLATRVYIALYEQGVTWRGKREQIRRAMRATGRYRDWVISARRMDDFFGNGRWKEVDDYAYYDSKTVRRVLGEIKRCRRQAERGRQGQPSEETRRATEELKVLIEACVKNNFVGIENPRLYSQTYYGTKNLVQNFIDELERSIQFLIKTDQLSKEEKRIMFKGICANYGRTALCLSGGATFAYYHFGVVKALLEEDYLPDIITGTSGGALVAGLVATRTNEELKELLVPALAHRITACSEPITVWFRRWWATGARFDSVDWAKQCAWWTRGSMTFREAYERTGRILNVSCVPSDPHSPTILCNYLTSPDCVIWSAVLASAAVPGILNPVVLMMKTRSGQLVPYSFGHKWKDGSLRTDIPIQALNLHFNVNFTIVSQVNPHINLFFFSSRGSVGQPVTHRRGRGWRGGYIGSATEQFIKLDLNKWLRLMRQLELLPRPLGQDWSMLWLQTFGGTVTIWPKSIIWDFVQILSDPDEARLARMIHEGQQSAYPKMRFVGNRLRVERLVERGRRESRFGDGGGGDGDNNTSGARRRLPNRSNDDRGEGASSSVGEGSSGGVGGGGRTRRMSIESILSEDDLRSLLKKRRVIRDGADSISGTEEDYDEEEEYEDEEGEGEEGAETDDHARRYGDEDTEHDEHETERRSDDEDEGGLTMATPMGLAGAETTQ
ncbi:acyl transferase/acyl hydrolase/lysophospholipase [Chaetomium sp. MPI-SDFR-AT-0129]|nr:acyl transferase/acyl hydrolase/lysophospholipase [Chaetomium sp. MPI-SDFR-AT-0129]